MGHESQNHGWHMTNVLLAGFTSHWLRRESSHENRREKTHKRYVVLRSVPSLWSGKREQILLDNKRGWKSTKIRPAECEVFFVDFSSYRTFRERRLIVLGTKGRDW